jgi:hypothetical protein
MALFPTAVAVCHNYCIYFKLFFSDIISCNFLFFLILFSQLNQKKKKNIIIIINIISSGRTARERWKLFKNISRLGLQRANITEEDHLSSVSLIEFKLVRGFYVEIYSMK